MRGTWDSKKREESKQERATSNSNPNPIWIWEMGFYFQWFLYYCTLHSNLCRFLIHRRKPIKLNPFLLLSSLQLRLLQDRIYRKRRRARTSAESKSDINLPQRGYLSILFIIISFLWFFKPINQCNTGRALYQRWNLVSHRNLIPTIN